MKRILSRLEFSETIQLVFEKIVGIHFFLIYPIKLFSKSKVARPIAQLELYYGFIDVDHRKFN